MDFSLPADLVEYLGSIDRFIDEKIKPIEERDDNIRFFDHRREHARTDWDRDGLPRHDWEDLLWEVKRLADDAGFWRYAMPKRWGGSDGSNLWMAVIREHLSRRGLGLHNDLQNEHSIVGNFPAVMMLNAFGTDQQKQEFIPEIFAGRRRLTFGLTEPDHGSDATHMETEAKRETRDGVPGWLINGRKMWISGSHKTSHCSVFARTSGKAGDAKGISAFIVEDGAPGFEVEGFMWTFNMPTDHARLRFTDVWVPDSAILGELDNGLILAQSFVHENRIRQAAASLGAAVFCVEESIKYARKRKPFGVALARNQAIQWPIVEISTQCEMLRLMIYKTALDMDSVPHAEIDKISDRISMCNYWANRLACEAADRAIQIHGGIGYSRHMPFEHLYRHHRRYRITEGSEEVQMRKIAGYIFGYAGPNRRRSGTD